ncbi:reverse transcriptase (RNA-dependent DNA polymerase) domain-containing protein [Hirsutella rhossiliensis]|uniref:Reverse transcriptase (RNA-dependent DNA polymerase) domain-containing protein n=1 Tax=Hirsutella rhossiliensis TaxID=111463 RepID=A0A9P8MMV4_9HYPO|nr:reverse transcriptase (RNA-dependent DNA polymerase) domain-containing protein [Hirsutella rhossiliensis]KAH0956906.1 reverse transcriptase (RNA-dependent DNA polymerase) domain-containing protein [Hirsutella rhossiliensis]
MEDNSSYAGAPRPAAQRADGGKEQELLQILSGIAGDEELRKMPEAAQEMDRGKKRKPMTWPKWNGQPESFHFYLDRLNGNNNVVWYEILQTLPDQMMRRVEGFGGKRARRATQTPEILLAPSPDVRQPGGASWDNASKLAWLRNSISPALREQLVPVIMPKDYNEYIQRLHPIAWAFEHTAKFKALQRKQGPAGNVTKGRHQASATSRSPHEGYRKGVITKETHVRSRATPNDTPAVPRFTPLFMKKEADKLNPHKPGIDHEIRIKEDPNGQQLPLPYGALYDAKWFTKVDVVQAFHKVRVAEGDEWKTAFRTRYATFQRYINGILRDYLDEFASAYMDDILIYSSGSREDHFRKVRLVLERLAEHGLHLDPEKCEFGVKRIKYLGFIIHAGIGIQADPDKIRAIVEWAVPVTQKQGGFHI